MDEQAPLPLAPEAVVELHDPAGLLVRWFCTPERLDELAAGWLVGEGRARSADLIGPIEVDAAAGAVRLPRPTADLRRPPAPPAREARRAPAVAEALAGDPDTLHELFRTMFDRGVLRERSGGVHTGALVTGREIRFVREDVSRHCVVDKLIGRATLDELSLEGAVVLLSGRISGAIAAKGARAGVALMATMSIPTNLAAEIADRSGVTLVGRARSASPHVYAPAPA